MRDKLWLHKPINYWCTDVTQWQSCELFSSDKDIAELWEHQHFIEESQISQNKWKPLWVSGGFLYLDSSLFQMVFSQDRHEDVLDLCLVQFEPDSSEYIKVRWQWIFLLFWPHHQLLWHLQSVYSWLGNTISPLWVIKVEVSMLICILSFWCE